MKKTCFILTLCCVFQHFAYSQSKPSPIFVGPDAPDWFLMMQAEKPNVREVHAAYEAYYRTHTFEKNSYTNYFKRWARWARDFEQADGSLHFPTAREQADREEKLIADRASIDRSGPANWTDIGPKQTYDTDGTTKVTWQTNCYSVDVSRANSNVILAGGESGGLFRTTDKGLNWTPLTHGITHGSFSACKNHPTDTDIFYAATHGKIIKSINGGATISTVFSFSGLDVNEFAISTTDPNVVIAAADEGLFRTANAGATWVQLFTNKTWTVKQKPGDGTTFYAIRDNGTSSDFLISIDFGATWTASNTGLYQPISGEEMTGGIIAVCPSAPSQLYAYLCGAGTNLSGFIGVFKSTNGGATWANTEPTDSIGSPYSVPGHVNLMTSGGLQNQLEQGFYDMAIFVDPLNADNLLAGGTSWWKSTNGGATWTALGGYAGGLGWSHPDIQWIDGVAGETWIASDGGLNFSTDFFASPHEARMNGISGSDTWGFDSGWNEDILVGGRYHNGNMGWHESFPDGKFYRLGGGEASTGYVNPGPERKVYHSDISGKKFLGGFTAGVSDFSVGDFPNEHYAYYQLSEMSFHPQTYNTVFIGKDNKLRVSTDGGATYVDKYIFPGTATNKVFEVEICRSNPLVMYISQFDGTDDKVWKTTDGGASFAACGSFPFGTNNNDRVRLAASATDENVLWASVSYGSDMKKICKSTDGGATWTNLTTAIFNGYEISDIMAAHGTDGGIYAACNGAVFYRNNTTDWVNFSTGLPLSFGTIRLKPFYKEGKIRLGANNFGVWESPLYETSTTLPMAMVDKKLSYCLRDTFYFDDYSVVNHTGTTWSWSFPGAVTVIGANTRTPKVVYGTVGMHTATMTVTPSNGTAYTSSVTVEVLAGCEADTTAGQVLRTAANGDFWQHSGSNLTDLTHFTVTGWWKPNGAQQAYSALFSSGDWCAHCDYTEGLIFDYYGTKLWYKWPGNAGSWASNSGITIPLNEWSYVALVITPTSATMYLNDKTYVHNIALSPGQIENLHIGYGHYSKSFKGDIDEVTMWKKALTSDEVRRLRHITREDLIPSDPDLIGYWQFSETMPNGDVQDNAGVRHGRLHGGASLAASTAPVGGGSAQLLPLTSGNFSYNFSNIGTSVQMSDCDALSGSMVATRLNVAPNIDPVSGTTAKNDWFLNYYSGTTSTTFAPVEQIELTATDALFINNIDAAGQVVLHQRTENGDAATWSAKAKGVAIAGSKITFNRKSNITSGIQIGLSDGAPAFSETDPGSPCGLNDGPKKSLQCNGGGNYAKTNAAIPLGTTNTISISAWIKPNGTQTSAAGIVFTGSGGACGMNFWSNNQLGYHWADSPGSYNWTGGPTIPAGVWSHLVMVVTPTSATFYLNGTPYTRTAAHNAVNFSSAFTFGNDRDNTSRTFNGELDEIRIYNRSLSQNEVRELRHLTYPSYGALDANLISYYKMNEATGQIYDRAGTTNGTLLGTATRLDETGPFEKGTSERQPVSVSGQTANFSTVGLSMTFGSPTIPNGEICVSRLDSFPIAAPAGFELVGKKYWVVNNHGANASFSAISNMTFSGLAVNSSVPSRYQLYKRPSNSHLAADWTLVDAADAVTTGANGSITFSTDLNLTSFSQFAIFEKGVRVAAKVFLQAAYSTSTGLLNENLRTLNLLPTAEPHTALGFPQAEGGGETCTASVFQTSGNDAIVDWVFVELRDKNNPATRLYTRSALLQKDGDVVDIDGVSPVHFWHAQADDYYVAVRHRNHLGARSLALFSLTENPTTVDFTGNLAALYKPSGHPNEVATAFSDGKIGLWAGNANGDEFVKMSGAFPSSNDYLKLLNTLGSSTAVQTNVYSQQDLNMDGQVKMSGAFPATNDYLQLLNVLGSSTTIIQQGY